MIFKKQIFVLVSLFLTLTSPLIRAEADALFKRSPLFESREIFRESSTFIKVMSSFLLEVQRIHGTSTLIGKIEKKQLFLYQQGDFFRVEINPSGQEKKMWGHKNFHREVIQDIKEVGKILSLMGAELAKERARMKKENGEEFDDGLPEILERVHNSCQSGDVTTISELAQLL